MKLPLWLAAAARALRSAAAALLTALAAGIAHAQPAPDALAHQVLFMLQNHLNKTLCLERPASVLDVRRELLAAYPELAGSDSPEPQAVARALWTLYPCPFSPQRPQLRPAGVEDVRGSWVFPAASQALRYGPHSPARQLHNLAVTCEAVAYLDGAELRVAQVLGSPTCPFERAADFQPQRLNPAVASWTFKQTGRLQVQRSDVAHYVEEWDVYAVTADFTLQGVHFRAGDLLQYQRRAPGNEWNAATQFRHLQRLP